MNSLIGCELFTASEPLRKIDSKEGRYELLEDAYHIDRVKIQKRKDLLDSYKLEGGLESLNKLDIVQTATIEKDNMKVDFLIKNRNKDDSGDKSKEDILWENVLFLCYTIFDTFPDIKKIHFTADYYFIDRYGEPYKEKVFRSNVTRSQLKLINRDYLRPEMVQGISDFYMSEYIAEEEEK